MRIEYDPEVDALSIRFRTGEAETVHVTDQVAVDLDTEGRIISLEILDASQVVAEGGLDEVILQGVAAARFEPAEPATPRP
ncbi:MAG: DUF2283 domain-containing protein [Dehalococcoidia bacterium]|nr:DUF2283 domain-containing protein [Dehalococcoidia bacterium]